MPRREVTGGRPTNFSQWHRKKLPDRCALSDVDWCEVREGRVVAILETIEVKKAEHITEAGNWILTDPWLKSWYPKYDERYPLWDTKRSVINFLIGTTKVPFFVIYHTPDMVRVRVIDYRAKTLTDFDEEAFATWLTCKW